MCKQGGREEGEEKKEGRVNMEQEKKSGRKAEGERGQGMDCGKKGRR